MVSHTHTHRVVVLMRGLAGLAVLFPSWPVGEVNFKPGPTSKLVVHA